MQLEFQMLSSLPRLAWLARVREGDDAVEVLHGPWVETREEYFVEGSWDEPFAGGAFDESAVLAGSGARAKRHAVVFATPANMYERLQSVRAGRDVLVSNSLAFLLAVSGDRLDPDHPHYYLDLLELYRWGIHQKEKRLRLAGGRWMDLHDCCNLEIGRDGGITRIEKPWSAPPARYEEYASMLERTLRRVIENAGDGDRRRRYRPVAMISQGYDSTAVAALASPLGCREAVTFLKSDSRYGYIDDSGAEIARCLGLEITCYERNDHATMPDFRPEEFYVEPWGVDRNMAVMEAQLTGALLLSGRSGESVWTCGKRGHWGLPDLQHPLGLIPGCALGEFRLRTGFHHFAPATIAAIHAPVIHRWNEAPEMAPWSIGGRYDKPIARRIAEEAGVPRELFGQVKKGGPEQTSTVHPVRRCLRRLTRSPRSQALIRRTFGTRFHPRWKQGSFEIQEGVERMVERYRAAVAAS